MTAPTQESDDTVATLMANTSLVKALLQGLENISYMGAVEQLRSLRAWAKADRTAAPQLVHPDALRYILAMLPPLADMEPKPAPTDKLCEFRYRIGSATLSAAQELLDRSARHRIIGGDEWLPNAVARLIWSGQVLFGNRWQSDLARALNVSDRTVRAWVASESKIPANIWTDIEELLRQRRQETVMLLQLHNPSRAVRYERSNSLPGKKMVHR